MEVSKTGQNTKLGDAGTPQGVSFIPPDEISRPLEELVGEASRKSGTVRVAHSLFPERASEWAAPRTAGKINLYKSHGLCVRHHIQSLFNFDNVHLLGTALFRGDSRVDCGRVSTPSNLPGMTPNIRSRVAARNGSRKQGPLRSRDKYVSRCLSCSHNAQRMELNYLKTAIGAV